MKDKTTKIILSFLISVILWFYIDAIVTKTLDFSVEIKYFDLPDDMVIIKKQELFSYNIILSKYSYYEFKQPPLEVRVSLKDVMVGKNYIEPEIIKKFDIPYLARISLSEKKIFVEVDKKEIKEVEINPVIDSQNLFLVKDITVTPKVIKIEGPSKILKNIKTLETSTYTVNSSGIYSKIIPIKNPYKNVYLSVTSVKVDFKAIKKIEERFILIPIKVKNLSEDFEAYFSPKSVNALVKGNFDNFKENDLNKLYFYVDCKEITNEGNYKLNLKIDINNDSLIIEPFDIRSVDVTIKRRLK
ncbi:MAG TPA: hypothetical protein PKW55_04515 [Spirochaetota bacterium]|nr:hypothetical protein [Spirochaetota bacterium]HOM37899.1 hypothetical protein [Spirochaetota bacterium]HPQ48703.1 hypothetical protein [Spirochaetota bacterium]